eukprot:TRINITY_DN14045_c0_g1_i1.p1 TRINITY_DN14045_c0_g1~~TRINITY_DN14045_c0_g1_i1.p1  ORF type:complete len:160 (-),score=36.31 TRINITY_DN14045_c0_g1_i1:86-565(-)
MPQIKLLLKADLENLTNLRPLPDINWYIKFKCSNCGEVHDKACSLNASEKFPVSQGKAEANLVLRCKFCRRENTVDVLPKAAGIKPYLDSDSGKFVHIASFDCRGVEPVEFEPKDGFAVDSALSEQKYEIDLSSKEFCDIDESTNEPVGIYELQSKFEK